MSTCRSLIVVLGDQLSPTISSLAGASKEHDIILMMEVMEEATYVAHHKKKIAFILSAMRHFAQSLSEQGWTVDYVRLEDPNNQGSFSAELERAVERNRPDRILITEPGEWRVLQAVEGWSDELELPVEVLPDDRFVCSLEPFRKWANGRKQLRMEFFYRYMRRSTGLLMNGNEPEGERWNFDADNRRPASADLFMARPVRFAPDAITKDVIALVSDQFGQHMGTLDDFWFATTAEQAEWALDIFIEKSLPRFGDFQDAMLSSEPFLYHSVLSAYINVGLLDPLSVCKRAEAAYYTGSAPLNAVEGFIRQIIGWREYVRGIYWLKMPDYRDINFFEVKRPLPDFYWTADTKLNCLSKAIGQTIDEAYAHHIQRLMITGNFAMLAGLDPEAVHQWYLSVYVDAFEWVELPNTLGMSQFADGGLLGSKPYASGGNYINKMSDYCRSCSYDVRQRTGEAACPFNALYWHFLHRNRGKLAGNRRLALAYRSLDRMEDDQREGILQSADAFLKTLGG
ncbi:MAG: cryptochrome/photolyase family protein [Pseudomonadota bacterium]